MWLTVNNCHVKIWVAAPINAVPMGAATYDGPAQLMTPGRPGVSQAHVWGPRIVIPPAQLAGGNQAFLGDLTTTATYVQIVDDVLPQSYSWWQAVDVSLSSSQNPLGAGYVIDAAFVMLQSVTSF